LLPSQAQQCSLFEHGVMENYNPSTNKLFLDKVDNKLLVAKLQQLDVNNIFCYIL